MALKEMFREKIEAEYEDYLAMISGYDPEEIAEESRYIADFQSIYTYLHDNEPLTDEQMLHFMKTEHAIELIANRYSPQEEEMHSAFMIICEDITDNKLYAIGCSENVNELLKRMGEELDETSKPDEVAEAEKDVFEYMIKISSNISNHLAKSLLQFKKPIEVIRAATKGSPSLINVTSETEEYIDNHDIFTLPHKLDYDRIIDESKWRHEAINTVLNIVPNPDFTRTMRWLDFFRTLEDQGLEFEDDPYVGFVRALNVINDNQGKAILQQLYDLEKDTLILENELIEAAKYLADGGDYSKIPELAENGFFDVLCQGLNNQNEDEEQEQQGGMDLC